MDSLDILLDEAINLEDVVRLCRVGIERRSPEPRDSTLWHVTSLLYAGHGIAKGNVSYSDGVTNVTGPMSFGSLWELMVDCYLADYAKSKDGIYLPDREMCEDGIIGSLDGTMFLPGLGSIVCETKLRFTLNNEIPLAHLQQMRAYCHLAGSRLCYYVSGHLSSRPPTALARIRLLQMTERSIEETWNMIVNTRDYLVKCGRGPEQLRAKGE